ncbi:MAG TPA: cyanophycinase [Puia sp.]|nr:cyanophycinase [Puia sp.]
MNRKGRVFLIAAIMLCLHGTSGAQQPPVQASKVSVTRHGPENGSLIIIGGAVVTADIWKKFTELAGGVARANIVVITTAAGDSAAYRTNSVEEVKRATGVQQVFLLHTNDRNVANSDSFIAPLKQATAVFIIGGRQWRLADSYLNTRTLRALSDLLDRGGVIAGTSAGASIQGSFLWRGDTRGAQILVGDHTKGFGFLKNSVIDQHLLARNRQFDLVGFIRKSPELIGIGLDQSTAVLIQKDTLEVIGASYAAIYDYNTIMGKGAGHVTKNDKGADTEDFTASSGPFFFLSAGQRYDLRNRKLLPDVPGKRPDTRSVVEISQRKIL